MRRARSASDCGPGRMRMEGCSPPVRLSTCLWRTSRRPPPRWARSRRTKLSRRRSSNLAACRWSGRGRAIPAEQALDLLAETIAEAQLLLRSAARRSWTCGRAPAGQGIVALTQRFARQAGRTGAEGTHHFFQAGGVSGQWVLLIQGFCCADARRAPAGQSSKSRQGRLNISFFANDRNIVKTESPSSFFCPAVRTASNTRRRNDLELDQ